MKWSISPAVSVHNWAIVDIAEISILYVLCQSVDTVVGISQTLVSYTSIFNATLKLMASELKVHFQVSIIHIFCKIKALYCYKW